MIANLKRIWIAVAAVVGILLILLAKIGLAGPSNVTKLQTSQSQASPLSTQNESVGVLTTSPSPLDQATIFPTQTIEITFSEPAQNVPELKVSIEPTVDINLELSDDLKTLKISPKSSFGLGEGYTITIPADAKFKGDKTLGNDLQFHFKTINYSGV